MQTATANTPGRCLLGGQILRWRKAATMRMVSFNLQGNTHPSFIILSTELLSNLPQPRVSKLAVMGLITSELLVRPSCWRKTDAGRSTDHQLRWGKLAPIHWQPLHISLKHCSPGAPGSCSSGTPGFRSMGLIFIFAVAPDFQVCPGVHKIRLKQEEKRSKWVAEGETAPARSFRHGSTKVMRSSLHRRDGIQLPWAETNVL